MPRIYTKQASAVVSVLSDAACAIPRWSEVLYRPVAPTIALRESWARTKRLSYELLQRWAIHVSRHIAFHEAIFWGFEQPVLYSDTIEGSGEWLELEVPSGSYVRFFTKSWNVTYMALAQVPLAVPAADQPRVALGNLNELLDTDFTSLDIAWAAIAADPLDDIEILDTSPQARDRYYWGNSPRVEVAMARIEARWLVQRLGLPPA